ncbi:MAG: enoyl-CoA hydratase-related protein [Candidatus Puniceispirillaceae bacterium]
MTELVLTEKLDNNIVVLRLNRPEALNALNIAARKAISDSLAKLQDDEEVRCIILTGDEKAFAAGADLKELSSASSIDMFKRRTERYWQTVTNTPQPIIAAIQGYAMGGGLELAMMCDLIVVGENAQLAQPEIKVGIMPGAGGTQRLTRAVGKYNAMKINLLGKPFSGQQAYDMGLACEVCADAEVMDVALKMATNISRMPPLAVQAIKQSILHGQDASMEAALFLERKAFQQLFASEDQTEGMQAFIEKRRPGFTGK